MSTAPDFSKGMTRIEITCTRCSSHLGHVFSGEEEREHSETSQRHCVNSLALRFVKGAIPDDLVEVAPHTA